MKVHQRKVRVQGVTNSSLTELQSFPLGGLVAGREENLSSSCWLVEGPSCWRCKQICPIWGS